jgi:hypothetical protein
MKKVRRSKASADGRGRLTPIDRPSGKSADASERRAKRRKARRQAERVAPVALPRDALVALFACPGIVDTILQVGAAIIAGAARATEQVTGDSALLDVARAAVGQVKLQGPTCSFSTSEEPERCGRAAPRFFAREGVEHGPELALCDEHAERVRAWLPVTDRTPPFVPTIRLYDPETRARVKKESP